MNGLSSTNTMNMSNSTNLHPSNTQITASNQIMHSSILPPNVPQQTTAHHMQSTDADQTRQQMTTNSRLKSFIQSRQHNGITKTPAYSPTQSSAYNSKFLI